MEGSMKPKKISIRPANNLEGEGIIVWIYHRRVQIQLQYSSTYGTEAAIADALETWSFAMENVR